MALIQMLATILLSLCTAYGDNLATLCVDKKWPSGLYPHPTRCDKFIECSNGVTNIMLCPTYTSFNPNNLVCEDPAHVPMCQGGIYITTQQPTTSMPTTSMPTTNMPTTSMPTTNMQATNISTTNVAETNVPSTNRLTTKLPTTNQPITNTPTVDMSKPTTANAMTTVSAMKDVNDLCAADKLTNGIHPHPYNCRMYIECTFLSTDIMNCPPGLAFDSNLLTCVNAYLVPSCHISTTAGTTKDPSKYDVKTVCTDLNLREGIHPHPKLCEQFIECSGRQTIPLPCPPGLHFNLNSVTCDDEHNVNCQDNIDYYTNIIIG